VPRSARTARAAVAPAVSAPVAAAPARSAAVPNVDRINAINVGLMLLSAALAWVMPFELFILSYAILGPLHYLTEISWLHDRGYFTTSRWDVLPVVVLGVLAFVARYSDAVSWDGWVLVAFAIAGACTFVSSPRTKLALAVVAVLGTLLVQHWGAVFFMIAVLLPTLIHVVVFTGVFILHGALRSRSAWGHASLVVYVLCCLGLLLYQPPAAHYVYDRRTSVLVDEFKPVIDVLARLTGTDPARSYAAFVAIGRFLAFAYTYHYLNWFSKTGVIRWHTVSRRRMTGIAALYAASLGVYAYDYATGLVALFVLSLLHVLLEFPLDVRTIAGLASRPVAAAR
jgi:hypothetical protein